MSGSERRTVILAAARGEFARVGYHGASTANIARAASCSEPMLYKHFAGKHALFAAVLEQATAQLDAGFDALFALPGDLFEHWSEHLPKIMRDPVYAQMMQLRMLAVTIVDEPEVRQTLGRLQARHIARVGLALERAVRDGYARADVDAEYVAWMWTGLMSAACFRSAIEPDGFANLLPATQAFIETLRP